MKCKNQNETKKGLSPKPRRNLGSPSNSSAIHTYDKKEESVVGPDIMRSTILPIYPLTPSTELETYLRLRLRVRNSSNLLLMRNYTHFRTLNEDEYSFLRALAFRIFEHLVVMGKEGVKRLCCFFQQISSNQPALVKIIAEGIDQIKFDMAEGKGLLRVHLLFLSRNISDGISFDGGKYKYFVIFNAQDKF